MKRTSSRLVLTCLLASGLTLGCGHSPAPEGEGAATTDAHDHAAHDHEGHDHPEPTNFTEALANVEAINGEISEAFAAGDMDEADHALHEAFDAVKALSKFATMDKLADDKTKEVAEASEAMLTAYDYLHGVHGGKEVDFGKVKADLEAAIARLAAVDPNHPDDHDHGSEKKPEASDTKAASDKKDAAE